MVAIISGPTKRIAVRTSVLVGGGVGLPALCSKSWVDASIYLPKRRRPAVAGADAFTVNVTVLSLVDTPSSVAETVRDPAVAAPVMVNVAVIVPAFTHVTALADTPAPLIARLAVEHWRFVPVTLTPSVWPCAPLGGAMDVRCGWVTLKFTVSSETGPESNVTPMVRVVRAAPPEIDRVAVIDVELAQTILPADTPVPLICNVAVVQFKFVPVNVIGTDSPMLPDTGDTDVKCGAVTLKLTVLSEDVVPLTVMPIVRTLARAVFPITKLAVMVVTLTHVGEVTLIPVPLTCSVTELHVMVVPVKVMATVVP
jgi:hypothetical protein